MIGQVAFFLVFTIACVRVVLGVRAHNPASVALSAFGAMSYLVYMYVPARLQMNGIIESKLTRAGLLSAPIPSEVDTLSLSWAVELGSLILAEFVGIALLAAWRTRSHGENNSLVEFAVPTTPFTERQPENSWWGLPSRVVAAAILIGAASYIIFPPPVVEARAEVGQGLGTFMRGFLVTGLALLVYFGLYRRKLYAGVLIGGILGLVYYNVRSPLIVIFLAFLAAAVNSKFFESGKRVAVSLILIGVVALTGSLMSNLRENSSRHLGFSAVEVFEATISNPLSAPFKAGIDTLDGYRLSEYAAKREPARPESILTAVTTVVPRSWWSEKPDSLAVDISRRYLGYRASGQFLSPTGYLLLAFGSKLAAIVALFVFGLAMTLFIQVFRRSAWLIFVFVITFRFLLGGSPFDIYYGLTLIVAAIIARAVAVGTSRRVDPALESSSGEAPSKRPATRSSTRSAAYLEQSRRAGLT